MRVEEYRRLPAEEGLAAEMRALEREEEALLLWEAASMCAVLGRSGAAQDVIGDVPTLRRTSGGGAVLLGPGCLNYALTLSLEARPELLDVQASYGVILGALAPPGARVAGSDLVLGDRKFAGHAQRRTRTMLLHHGTILYDFPLDSIGRLLREPARQPAYRRRRTHAEFLVNAPLSLEALLTWVRRVPSSLNRR